MRLGECWPRAQSDLNVNKIVINPLVSDGTMVLGILAHELLHAADDCESKHGTQFTVMSKLIGFSGGKHSAPQSGEAKAAIAEIAASLGPYPRHASRVTRKRLGAVEDLKALDSLGMHQQRET